MKARAKLSVPSWGVEQTERGVPEEGECVRSVAAGGEGKRETGLVAGRGTKRLPTRRVTGRWQRLLAQAQGFSLYRLKICLDNGE